MKRFISSRKQIKINLVPKMDVRDVDREGLVFMAIAAEEAERYEDMANFMRTLVLTHPELTTQESNLFSIAFKNMVGKHRASYRFIASIHSKVEEKQELVHLPWVIRYENKIGEDLRAVCLEVLHLLEGLLPYCQEATKRVFYYKMKGDYFRYLSEVCVGPDQQELHQKAVEAYGAAEDANDLPATHPIRLGSSLSRAVFMYEIMDEPALACQIAKTAFDAAIAELDNLTEEVKDKGLLLSPCSRNTKTVF